ncbi:MAG: murein biosynthesis integral membrane protein MurJ [Acidimicrobiales bacterium]
MDDDGDVAVGVPAGTVDDLGTGPPAPTVMATGRLVRSSAVVAVGTALSRVTGLVRTSVLVGVFGIGALTDAYNVASNTPHIIYELILGGILSATLVPIFVEQAERDDPDGASAIVTVTMIALVVLTLGGVLAAPLIIRIYTWAKPAEEAAEQAAVAVPLMRMFVPQMLLYGITALATALLNARRRYLAPAYSPILNNIVVVAMLLAAPVVAGRALTFDVVRDRPGLQLLLGLGTTAGVVAMTIPLVPAVRRAGWRLRWNPAWRHPAVGEVVRLSGWTVGYVIANQVALAIVLALANRNEGQVAAYTTAFVFFQLPHGLIAVSFMTTFVPELAAAANDRAWATYRSRFSLGIRLMALLILPAGVGYALLSRPLVGVLLERGQFDAADSALTADVLANFAIGLLGFSVYLFALRGFYALRDTRTPFILNVIENAVNVVLAVALVGRYGAPGLALAYAIAYLVSACLALAVLRRRVSGIDGRRLATSSLRLVGATAVMGLAVWGVTRGVGGDSGTAALARIGVAVPVGVVVYGLALVAVRAEELRGLRSQVASRRRVA